MPSWLYFVLGFVALIVALTVWNRVWLRRLATSRIGENYDTFCSSFGTNEIPEDVLRAVYKTFQEWCSGLVAEFPVRAADDIGGIYGMVDEDLDDAVMEVLAECGRKLLPEEQCR